LLCYRFSKERSELFSYDTIKDLSDCTIFANWAVVLGLRFIT
jgi:hypothetical protein